MKKPPMDYMKVANTMSKAAVKKASAPKAPKSEPKKK